MKHRKFHEVVAEIDGSWGTPDRKGRFERFSEALLRLGLPLHERREDIIVIAGTNGKGTVAKTLETVFSASGLNVGLFTSPHLMEITERIRTENRDLSRDEFIGAFEFIAPIAREFGLSHFEILTLMMAEVFFGGRVRRTVDKAILEVGLGGRLDPTRAFPHSVSVITRLGLDHQEILGATLAEIAAEKMAIVENQSKVFHTRLDAEVLPVRDRVIAEKRGEWRESSPVSYGVIQRDRPVWQFNYAGRTFEIAMQGSRAVENMSLALDVFTALGGELNGDVERALAEMRWPGRMEGFEYRRKKVYISGDHNPQGVRSLVEVLKHHRYRELRLITGIGRGKDFSGMVEEFARLQPATWIFTETPFRARDQNDQTLNIPTSARYVGDWHSGFREITECTGSDDLIVISGSLYLVGDVRTFLLSAEHTKPIK